MSIENQTKADIQKLFFQNLEQKDRKEAKVMEELFNKTVKDKSKAEYVNFYHMVTDEVQ